MSSTGCDELIEAILRKNDIDPQRMVGERTAFDMLEAAVMGVLDEIEENIEENS